jgi:hypothetical protein
MIMFTMIKSFRFILNNLLLKSKLFLIIRALFGVLLNIANPQKLTIVAIVCVYLYLYFNTIILHCEGNEEVVEDFRK